MEALGINITSITIYISLFTILYIVVDRFLIRNLIKTLNSRQNEIAKGIELTEKAEARMNEMEREYVEKMDKATQEVRLILKDAKKQGDALKSEELKKGKQEADQIRDKAQQQLTNERASLKEELKSELSEIISDALITVLNEDLDEKTKRKLVSKAIDNFS